MVPRAGNRLGTETGRLGEGEQQLFVGQKMIEDARQKAGLAGRGANRPRVDPGQRQKAAEAFGVGGEECQSIDGYVVGFA